MDIPFPLYLRLLDKLARTQNKLTSYQGKDTEMVIRTGIKVARVNDDGNEPNYKFGPGQSGWMLTELGGGDLKLERWDMGRCWEENIPELPPLTGIPQARVKVEGMTMMEALKDCQVFCEGVEIGKLTGIIFHSNKPAEVHIQMGDTGKYVVDAEQPCSTNFNYLGNSILIRDGGGDVVAAVEFHTLIQNDITLEEAKRLAYPDFCRNREKAIIQANKLVKELNRG